MVLSYRKIAGSVVLEDNTYTIDKSFYNCGSQLLVTHRAIAIGCPTANSKSGKLTVFLKPSDPS